MPDFSLIRTKDLAALLGVHPDTVSRWSSTVLRDAIFRRGKFKVSVLKAMGIWPEIPKDDSTHIRDH